ncbi:MAG: ABC transporter ATP-binding protein [Arthrobacter sp.]|uniref:ABC transporter ATP-binding protein n=1 Tax=Arthrobacter sp. TaxID=1667 RepID=UPI00348D25E2
MGSVIDIRGLEKSFGRAKALDGLELQVAPGEVHGFLGPNGAGKSTTIRVLLGLLRADAGTVRLLGGDPWRDVVALHRRIAYVPGDVSLWPTLTGGEAIDLLGRLRGGLNEERRRELAETFELDTTKRGRAYSKGNRQKVAIVAALASDVELLILDEPTSGLDPLMEAKFRAEVRAERGKGRSVLLSSHILAEVEALADRISIIRAGAIVDTGTLDEMRTHARSRVRARVTGDASSMGRVRGVEDLHHDDGAVEFSVEGERLAAVLSELTRLGMTSLEVSPPSLEDLFLRHYGDRPADTSGHDGEKRHGRRRT